jgi:hypothetical protein
VRIACVCQLSKKPTTSNFACAPLADLQKLACHFLAFFLFCLLFNGYGGLSSGEGRNK